MPLQGEVARAGMGGVDGHGSFASILEGCRPLFPRTLVDADGWRRVLEVAGHLPRSVIDEPFGFELRLGEPSPEADFFVAVRPRSELAQHFIREGARAERGSSPAAKTAAATNVAAAAAALAASLREQATDPGSFLARCVGNVVLEYDLAGLAPHHPPAPPGIFLSPRKSATVPPGENPFRHEDPAGLLAALAVAVGWDGHEEMQGTVERIFASLPEGGHVFQAGALPGRSPKAFRILLGGVAAERVPALLERVQWPGPADEAGAVLASMEGLFDLVAVSLDVTARGPGPRLGLELYRLGMVGWHPFIARIEENGWCLPAKAEGLRRWRGAERLFGAGEAHRTRMGLSHVKLVVEGGARTHAKAYAGMSILPDGGLHTDHAEQQAKACAGMSMLPDG